MCGIAGWLGHIPAGDIYCERMAQALRHRGPDGYGIRHWPFAALVHTRLSIIDLSTAGTQPMSNEDGSIWTVFNGEIYNHRDLRRDLETHGHVLKGRSDSEVLPHLYEQEGPSFVSKLRGMFALAVYDFRNNTILLARDRFGIKPLFYALCGDRLVFASEIRAILTVPGVDTRPDRQAVYDYTAMLYMPAPQTFYEGVRSLMPGEVLEARLEANGISCRTYRFHQWTIAPNFALTPEQAANRAEELVSVAVSRQLESDVPLGSLLSGGIDSSLVSAAAQSAVGGRLKTFNAKFSDHEYDETWAAVAVANHIHSDHRTLDMSGEQGSWSRITDLLRHAGQPFADTSLFAVNAVCRLMRQHVTVALSGDGGDEAFGGYDPYSQVTKLTWLERFPRKLSSGVGLVMSPLATIGLVPARLAYRLNDFLGKDNVSIVQALSCWIRPEEQQNLFQDPAKVIPTRRLFEPQWEHDFGGRKSRVERLSAHMTEIGIQLGLSDDFLFKVDTASMKESLEVRVPMLDEDLFAFGLSLPHQLKVESQRCKRVLRDVARRKLPAAVADKRKWGFGIPVDRWVSDEFKSRLREELLGSSSGLPEFFRPGVYRPIIEAFCDGRQCESISRQGLYQRAIMFLSVHLFRSGDLRV